MCVYHPLVLAKLLSTDLGRKPTMAAAQAVGDCFAVLGLEPGAKKTDVNSAYRKLSRKVHPDQYKGDNPEWATEQFLRLTRAKEVLNDDKVRAAYEALCKARDAHKAKQEAQHAGRKHLREDLEEREEAAKRQRCAAQLGRQEQEAEAAARSELEHELERLRSAAAAVAAAAAAPATAASSGNAGSSSETAKLSLRLSADKPHTRDSLTALLEKLAAGGAQAAGGLTLAIVGRKGMAELGLAMAVRLMARSVELSDHGVLASWSGEPPAAATAAAAAAGPSAALGAAAAPSAAAPAPAPLPLPPGWRECIAPDGKSSYFYHTATRRTQWKRPAASAAFAPAGAGAAAAKAGGGGLGAAGGVSAADHETLENVTMHRLRQASERHCSTPKGFDCMLGGLAQEGISFSLQQEARASSPPPPSGPTALRTAIKSNSNRI